MNTTPLIDPRTGKERKKRFVTQIRAEQYWVEKARNNPIFFQHYLLDQKPAKHMEIWLANIFDPSSKRINFIAPRESAKTTTIQCALAWIIGKNPFSTNAIISVSASQAEARLRTIKGYITDNTKYKNVFPHVHIDDRLPNTQTEFMVYSDKDNMPYHVWRTAWSRYSEPNNTTMWVAGVGGSGIIGRRFNSVLVLDDIIDEKTLSADAQDKVYQYVMQTLIPCVKEDGKVINIGTRWMVDDFPQRLEENPAWKTISISSMRPDPQTGEPKSYWPEEWSVERLEDKRQEMGHALFEIMYQSNPRALAGSNFSRESLSQPLPFPLPKLDYVYIGTDWAISLKTAADFTVYAAIGIDSNRNYYILDMIRLKTSKNTLIDKLGEFSDKITEKYGKLNGVVVEKVGFQASILQDVSVMRPDLPVIPYTPKGDKGHRVSGLSSIAMQGKLFTNTSMDPYQIFLSEALNFPISTQHDDTLDAVTIVLQYTGIGIYSQGVKRVKSPYLL